MSNQSDFSTIPFFVGLFPIISSKPSQNPMTFYVILNCLSGCQCSSAGSLHDACHLITGECSCKDNVEGHNCDSCKDGTFNLDTANQQGCLHCFGYGRALSCKSANGFVASAITSLFVNETGKCLLSV